MKSHDLLLESHDPLLESHDRLLESHDLLLESHDLLLKSHGLLETHDLPVPESHGLLLESHDLQLESHDLLLESHDPLLESHGSCRSYDPLKGSCDHLVHSCAPLGRHTITLGGHMIENMILFDTCSTFLGPCTLDWKISLLFLFRL